MRDEDARGVAHLLNDVLCDEFVLDTKTRNYHWNVTGPQFSALHEFFERQYLKLDTIVDRVAERVRAAGGWAAGTVQEFAKRTSLEETPGEVPDAEVMCERLAADHETLIRHLRGDIATCEKKYHDAGTANFLTDLLEKHEKMAWMLRAHARAGAKAGGAKARSGRAAPVNLMDDRGGAGE
jgi:starvation-inducible DNA-binding protein